MRELFPCGGPSGCCRVPWRVWPSLRLEICRESVIGSESFICELLLSYNESLMENYSMVPCFVETESGSLI